MRILLIDIDSTIPNLALMKIAAYHKAQGDEVGFNISDPDKVYISVIYKRNMHKAMAIKFLYPEAEIDLGGSGIDLEKKLPPEIEKMTPDYSIYPDCDRFYGFTTRGCIRNCYFCIVPKKEGRIRCVYKTPEECLQNITGGSKAFKKIEFMDNNILAKKSWFYELCELLQSSGMKVDFNQGLDVRLLDDHSAKLLSKLKPITVWKFAFDDISYQSSVEKGIEILKRNGIDIKHKTMWYVYVHSDKDFDDALYRCRWLRDHKATPYVMLNLDTEHTKRMKDLKRWCRPWIFYSIDFDEYKKVKT